MKTFVAALALSLASVSGAMAQEVRGFYNFDSNGRVVGQSIAVGSSSVTGTVNRRETTDIPYDSGMPSAASVSIGGTGTTTRSCSTIIKADGQRYLRCE